MSLFENATAEQLEIIQNTEGYQRICAVPGSGKTRCIVERIAYLLTELYVDPSSVHAITFTNKAARNMTKRLKKLVGDEATCFTGTFHGKCNLILKEEIYRLSYPKTFSILDKVAQIDLVRLVAEEQGISLKDNTAANFLEMIEQRKQIIDYVADYMISPDKKALEKCVADAVIDEDVMYYNYLLKQRDNYSLDFQDLLMFAIYILTAFPDALEKWQDNCQYLLCDEYQDVNSHQEELLRLLSGKFHNLTVVGDDDQCIYGWRGSKVEYMVNFDKRYPDVKDFFLSENFRSTPEIVSAANSLILANQNRIKKNMHTNNPNGRKPVYNNLKTEAEEAIWMADVIKAAVASGKNYRDHTILVRAASQTRAIEEAFVKNQVPYKVLNGSSFYGAEEIRTVIAYLRMVHSLNDLDFEWTIKRPKRGFGKKALQSLRTYASQKGMTLMEALGDQIASGLMKKQDVIDYYNNIMGLHGEYTNLSCEQIVNTVLDFGYRQELQTDVDQLRLDNVAELVSAIGILERENSMPLALDELLAHFALFANQDDDTEKDMVKIMTAHTAKGLEFDTVFINGLVEGQFPSKRLTNQDEYEEERRLFYVAMTRAKKTLYLSSYKTKADLFVAHQSSFLSDIDPACLECINDSKIEKPKTTAQMRPKAEFQEGDVVSLKSFGRGTIVKVDESRQTYDIAFDLLEGTIRRIQFRALLEREK